MREEHLLNNTLLHATSMALVLMVLLGNGLAQWFSKKWPQPWAAKTGRRLVVLQPGQQLHERAALGAACLFPVWKRHKMSMALVDVGKSSSRVAGSSL